jgi:hypothetical protein
MESLSTVERLSLLSRWCDDDGRETVGEEVGMIFSAAQITGAI